MKNLNRITQRVPWKITSDICFKLCWLHASNSYLLRIETLVFPRDLPNFVFDFVFGPPNLQICQFWSIFVFGRNWYFVAVSVSFFGRNQASETMPQKPSFRMQKLHASSFIFSPQLLFLAYNIRK